MKRLILIFFIPFNFLYAQDDLMDLINANQDKNEYVSYLFKGSKIVNSQSVEMPSKKVLQFMIQHRFGTLSSGFYELYGLDNAQVRISFDYGVNKWMSFGLGRSSAIKTFDLNSKIRLKRQSKGHNSFPFTIVTNSAIFIKKYTYQEMQLPSFDFINQLSYANQLLIARKVNRSFTFQVTPTIVHHNLIKDQDYQHDKYSIGLGIRNKISNRISFNAEHFIQLNQNEKTNVLSLGFDIETGGHVFQLHFSNSSAMIESEFISNADGSWTNGDIYFGFNLSRVFKL